MPQSLEPLEPFGSGIPSPCLACTAWSFGRLFRWGGGNHLQLVCAQERGHAHLHVLWRQAGGVPLCAGDAGLGGYLGGQEFRERPSSPSACGRQSSPAWIWTSASTPTASMKSSSGEALSPERGEELLPTRQDLAALYRKLASLKGGGLRAPVPAGGASGFQPGKAAAVPGNAAGAASHCFAGRGGTQDRGAAAHPRESGYLRLPGLPAGQTAGRKLTEG